MTTNVSKYEFLAHLNQELLSRAEYKTGMPLFQLTNGEAGYDWEHGTYDELYIDVAQTVQVKYWVG